MRRPLRVIVLEATSASCTAFRFSIFCRWRRAPVLSCTSKLPSVACEDHMRGLEDCEDFGSLGGTHGIGTLAGYDGGERLAATDIDGDLAVNSIIRTACHNPRDLVARRDARRCPDLR